MSILTIPVTSSDKQGCPRNEAFVCCKDCGFLAKRLRRYPGDRHRPQESPSYEVTHDERETGALFECVLPNGRNELGEPFCFRDFAMLKAEVEALVPQSVRERTGEETPEDKTAARAVITRDRACTEWYEYIPGLNPKEHFQRREMQQLANIPVKLAELERHILEESNKLAQTLLSVVTDSKAVTQEIKGLTANSLTVMQDSKNIAERMEKAAKESGKFNRRINLWLIVLALLSVLGTGIQVFLAIRSHRTIQATTGIQQVLPQEAPPTPSQQQQPPPIP